MASMSGSMSEHTPGPWQWFGNEYGFYLATPDRGRQFVMDFVRMGMRGAQPRFQRKGIMMPAVELIRFEVDPSVVGMAAGKIADSVYRYDIIEIDHPDARLITAAPDLLEALKMLAACEHDPKYAREVILAGRAINKAEGND